MPVVRACLLAQCWQLNSCRRFMAVMRKMCWTHGLGSSRVVCDGRSVTRRLRLQERAFTQRFHMPPMRYLAHVRARGLGRVAKCWFGAFG